MIFIVLPAMLFIGLIPKHGQRLLFFVGLVAITATFAAMNMNKIPYSDWVWYTEHYLMTQNYTLAQYLGARIGWITIKWNEPVYYWLARRVARASGGNIKALAATITIINYGAIGGAVFVFGSDLYRSFERKVDSIFLLGCVLLAITFTLVTQLVRQELATSIAILGFALFARGKLYIPAALAFIAMGTHQSAVLVIIILYGPVAIFRWVPHPLVRVLFFFATALVLLGLGYYISTSSISELGRKNDGSVDTSLMAFDAALTVGIILINILRRDKNIYSLTILISMIYFWVMMASMIQVPLAMLRLYFTMDFIRAIAVAIIVIAALPRGLNKITRWLISILYLISSLFYVNARIDRSPFDYGGEFKEYLTYPFVIN